MTNQTGKSTYVILVLIATLAFIYFGISGASEYGFNSILISMLMLVFFYSYIWRFYELYKFEKLSGKHNHPDFRTYLEQDLFDRHMEFILPTPLRFGKYEHLKPKIRFFNLLTGMVYLSFILMMVLLITLKK